MCIRVFKSFYTHVYKISQVVIIRNTYIKYVKNISNRFQLKNGISYDDLFKST